MDTVNSYIAAFDSQTQDILQEIRRLILNRHKDISESMAYGMPAYRFRNKPLAYFGAFKKHIGLYATPNAHDAFKERLLNYKQGKGSVQFPLSKEIPFKLIEEIIDFRIQSLS